MDKCKRCEYYLKNDLYFYCKAKKELYEDSLLIGDDCPKEKSLNRVVSIISLAIQDRTIYGVNVESVSSYDAIDVVAYIIKCKVQPIPFYNKGKMVKLYISNYNKDTIICGYKTVVKEFIRSIKEYEEELINEINYEINEAIEDNKFDNGKK